MVEQKALDPDAARPAGRHRAGARRPPSAPRTGDGYEAAVKRAVERAFVDRLMSLAGQAPMAQVRAEAQYELEQHRRAAVRRRTDDADARQHGPLSAARVRHRPLPGAAPRAGRSAARPDMPPGDPIGEPGHATGWAGPARRASISLARGTTGGADGSLTRGRGRRPPQGRRSRWPAHTPARIRLPPSRMNGPSGSPNSGTARTSVASGSRYR